MKQDIQIAGVSHQHVLNFYIHVVFGNQYKRVCQPNNSDDLLIACLRMGWNDAFRHTSKNVQHSKKIRNNKGQEKTISVLEYKKAQWQKEGHPEPYDDFICGRILSDKGFLDLFKKYAGTNTPEEKSNLIQNNFDSLKELFGPYKAVEGEKKLCFGHFQKMFNMAIKLYLCLYMSADDLKLDNSLFDNGIIQNMRNADCPIDSFILAAVAKDSQSPEIAAQVWSKYGADDANHVDNYHQVQEKIASLPEAKNSKLLYDFIAW